MDGGRKYRDNPALLLIEPVNEPHYPDRKEVSESKPMEAAYQRWLKTSKQEDTSASYVSWRKSATLAYLDRMHLLLKEEGLKQPVIWNCGWPRLIQGHGDIFKAIADSKMEGISFCLYPGQDDLQKPFWENLRDLSNLNYLPYLQTVSDREDWLGWIRGERFARKAKVVYEYETFCNTSGYLYPAMAKLFRSLGAQVATQWTYGLPAYSRFLGGSHVFNLEATPSKAASFLIAGKAFKQLPRGIEYKTESATSDRFDGVALSFEKKLAAGAFGSEVIWSNTLPEGFVPLPELPTRLIGVGDSPYVKTNANGLFEIDLTTQPPRARLTPQWNDRLPHWLENFSKNVRVDLDRATSREFTLTLPEQDAIKADIPPDWSWKPIESKE